MMKYLLLSCFILSAPLSFAAEPPTKKGLALWADASNSTSLIRDAEGKVTGWKDLATGKQATVRGPVELVPAGMNGRDVLRFGTNGSLTAMDFPAWNDKESPITLFMVWQRTPDQASDREWQRLVACEDADRTKGFSITGAMRGSPKAIAPVLYTVSHVTAAPLPLTIGMGNPPSTGNPLRGDFAEILVYNRRFDNPDEFHAIESYLLDKWNCQPDYTTQGWLRPSNQLPPVAHTKTGAPHHDQANAGGWQPYAPWTDYFDGTTLDDSKWYDHNPDWHGRAPARYLPRNVTVADGAMGITMSRDAPTEKLILYGEGSAPYHTWAAGSTVSKTARTYGSFEIRCKAMASYATSAWWFIGRSTNEAGEEFNNEIDVFEIGATVPGEESRCGGNLHVVKAPGLTEKLATPAGWIAPFRFDKDWHTFGLDWGPEYIRWYLDGSCYRSVRNTHWHTPLRMLFDTEIWSWWPDPRPEDFPSTFEVDYVRAWSRSDWPEPKGLTVKAVSKGITRLLEKER